MSPILSLADLPRAVADWRADGAVIVLACGCWDPLHLGHIQHLEAAAGLGNVLIVGVASDRVVREYKSRPGGPRRPFLPDTVRAGIVAGLRCVNAVTLNDACCELIHAVKPHIYAKGTEYRDNLTPDLQQELELLKQYGGRLEFVSGAVISSSTGILTGAFHAVEAVGRPDCH